MEKSCLIEKKIIKCFPKVHVSLFHNNIKRWVECLDYNTCYEITMIKNCNQVHKAFLLLHKYKVYTSLYKEYTKAIHHITEVAVKEIFVMTFILMLFFYRKSTWKIQSTTRTFSKIVKNN